MGVRFVNVRELKNKTSAVLSSTQAGQDVIVTRRGKPYALIHEFAEEQLEDYVLANHPDYQEAVQKAEAEFREGKTTNLRDFIRERKRKSGKVRRPAKRKGRARA